LTDQNIAYFQTAIVPYAAPEDLLNQTYNHLRVCVYGEWDKTYSDVKLTMSAFQCIATLWPRYREDVMVDLVQYAHCFVLDQLNWGYDHSLSRSATETLEYFDFALRSVLRDAYKAFKRAGQAVSFRWLFEEIQYAFDELHESFPRFLRIEQEEFERDLRNWSQYCTNFGLLDQLSDDPPTDASVFFPRTRAYLAECQSHKIASTLAYKVTGHLLPPELVDMVRDYIYNDEELMNAPKWGWDKGIFTRRMRILVNWDADLWMQCISRMSGEPSNVLNSFHSVTMAA